MALVNKAGVPMAFGNTKIAGYDGSSTYYCGRWLGEELIPGSDGRCGPSAGPQCGDCEWAQRAMAEQAAGLGSRPLAGSKVNEAGVPMRLGNDKFLSQGFDGRQTYYCGRHLSCKQIPGSDGQCGPSAGPQCTDCLIAQDRLHMGALVNDAGAQMHLGGTGFVGYNGTCSYYCGRNLGTRAIPGSDGRCGPTAGPQCQDCMATQQRLQSNRTYKMYHGTSKATAANIQRTGFRPSSEGQLGPGVYLVDESNMEKAMRFAHDDYHRSKGTGWDSGRNEPVLIECEVAVAKSAIAHGSDETWQRCADACFAAETDVSASSEWCVKDNECIRILSVIDLKSLPCPWKARCPYRYKTKMANTPWEGTCPCQG